MTPEFIEDLKLKGLNIYLSSKIENLSVEMQNEIKKVIPADSDLVRVVLIGSGGNQLAQNFKFPLNKSLNLIDKFSISQINSIDKKFILYPNEIFTFPILKLSEEFNFSKKSPLGIHISSQFGLWFSFRLCFLTIDNFPDSNFEDFIMPCSSCEKKDCIAACPIKAVEINNFKLGECISYRKLENSLCDNSCLSRLSCPYKKEYKYSFELMNYFYEKG